MRAGFPAFPFPVNCSCATRKQLRGPLLSVKNASPCADLELATQCVQRRLACSVGGSPTGARVRSPVAWVASVEETKRMKPTDKAALGAVSESPGRNENEPTGGLDTKESGGRALSVGAKAAGYDAT